MSEIEAMQKTITRRAAKLANKRVREELLSETGEYSLVQRLSLAKGVYQGVLRATWNPLKADTTGKSGLGYRLKVEDDLLTLEILKDTHLYDRVVALGMQAMIEAMRDNSRLFVTTILDDYFSPAAFYKYPKPRP